MLIGFSLTIAVIIIHYVIIGNYFDKSVIIMANFLS